MRPTMLLSGELQAEEAALLVVPNPNIWPMTVRWLAEEGSAVRAGDPVVEFDSSQLTGNLELLASQVVAAANERARTRASGASERASAAFELERLVADLEKARFAAEVPREITSEQEWARRALDLEKAELEAEKGRRALETAREATAAADDVAALALEKAELALARAEHGLEMMTLRAPEDGIVLIADNPREGRPFRAGDATWPGLVVASLPDLSTLLVDATLFDVDDGRIEPGARVEASLEAFPDRKLTGTIRSVAGFADAFGARSTRRRFRVTVDLEGLDPERMRPGMSVRVVVAGGPVAGLVAPRAALDPGAGREPAGAVAFLAGGGAREVVLGPCDAHRCIVEGLAEGTALRWPGEVGG